MSQALPALVLFHVVASFQRIMPYWPLFGFISLIPLLGRNWAEGLKAHPGVQGRWLAALAVSPIVLVALVFAQDRIGMLEDRQGRLLGLVEPSKDPTIVLICYEQIAAELERRGLLNDPNTFLFTESWDRSARLALAIRGKVPVACYNIEARSFSFWSRPEDWVGRDGIFVEDGRQPGSLANYSKFFSKYEAIGTARIVRRGIVVREIYLYRGTYQTWAFPFDGRLAAKNPGPKAVGRTARSTSSG